MKKVFIIISVALIFSSAFAFGEEPTKIDPAFAGIQSVVENGDFESSTLKMATVKSIGGEIFTGAIIKATDVDVVGALIEEMGGTVRSKLKRVLTADIPVSIINELAEYEEVEYIEAPQKVRLKMNAARNDGITNVVSVQDGTGSGLTQAYTGTGVIFGAIDSGIDCTNSDFAGRILYIKDLSTGTEYNSSQIAVGNCPSAGVHGTHVTGIAASANTTYTGVAPAADIIMIKMPTSLTTNQVLESISYFFTKAQVLKRPAVMNMSIGSSEGPHDGTSPYEVGIDDTLIDVVGRAIVNAAGNEDVIPDFNATKGNVLAGIHATVNVAPGAVQAFDLYLISKYAYSACPSETDLGIWLTTASDCTVELDVYPVDSKTTPVADMSPVAPGESNQGTSGELTVGTMKVYVNFSDSNSSQSTTYKKHASAVISYPSCTGTDPASYSYDLVFRGGTSGCSGNVWVSPDSTSHADFTTGTRFVNSGYAYTSGDSNATITVPATATSVITAASYSARNLWTSLASPPDENQSIYGGDAQGSGTDAVDISVFSSLGPGTGSGNTQKPDIAAPGEPIVSTLASAYASAYSNYLKGDSTHLKMEGTSMSSPFIAGVIALMLEKNPCLTPTQIKTALIENVLAGDAFAPEPGEGWNATWGYGKVDALAAINSVTANPTCVPDNPSENPATSTKSGCTLIR